MHRFILFLCFLVKSDSQVLPLFKANNALTVLSVEGVKGFEFARAEKFLALAPLKEDLTVFSNFSTRLASHLEKLVMSGLEELDFTTRDSLDMLSFGVTKGSLPFVVVGNYSTYQEQCTSRRDRKVPFWSHSTDEAFFKSFGQDNDIKTFYQPTVLSGGKLVFMDNPGVLDPKIEFATGAFDWYPNAPVPKTFLGANTDVAKQLTALAYTASDKVDEMPNPLKMLTYERADKIDDAMAKKVAQDSTWSDVDAKITAFSNWAPKPDLGNHLARSAVFDSFFDPDSQWVEFSQWTDQSIRQPCLATMDSRSVLVNTSRERRVSLGKIVTTFRTIANRLLGILSDLLAIPGIGDSTSTQFSPSYIRNPTLIALQKIFYFCTRSDDAEEFFQQSEMLNPVLDRILKELEYTHVLLRQGILYYEGGLCEAKPQHGRITCTQPINNMWTKVSYFPFPSEDGYQLRYENVMFSSNYKTCGTQLTSGTIMYYTEECCSLLYEAIYESLSPPEVHAVCPSFKVYGFPSKTHLTTEDGAQIVFSSQGEKEESSIFSRLFNSFRGLGGSDVANSVITPDYLGIITQNNTTRPPINPLDQQTSWQFILYRLGLAAGGSLGTILLYLLATKCYKGITANDKNSRSGNCVSPIRKLFGGCVNPAPFPGNRHRLVPQDGNANIEELCDLNPSAPPFANYNHNKGKAPRIPKKKTPLAIVDTAVVNRVDQRIRQLADQC